MPSFWNIRVLYGPVPALLWPIDLALSIACLKLSTVLISGLCAHAITRTGKLNHRPNHFAVLDELVKRGHEVHHEITRRIRSDLLVRLSNEIDHDFAASRFLVSGRKLAHAGNCALIDQNGEFGC